MPDTDWMKGLIPDVELDKFRSNLIKVGESIKGKANEIDIGEEILVCSRVVFVVVVVMRWIAL